MSHDTIISIYYYIIRTLAFYIKIPTLKVNIHTINIHTSIHVYQDTRKHVVS